MKFPKMKNKMYESGQVPQAYKPNHLEIGRIMVSSQPKQTARLHLNQLLGTVMY
jgi:hypothetical protein